MKRSLALVPLFAAAALVGVTACGAKKDKGPVVQTAAVTRRTIIIDAEAQGAIEPINIVEVKSKASGLITKMPVETGSLVKPGDLLVQIDTRDVQNQYNQADADLKAAQAKLSVSESQKKRSDEMFKARVITAQEHETAQLDFENSKAAVVRSAANLDLAKQRLEDATVTAPVAGTVIDKTVSLGTVITSATGAFGGGTTLLKMADLGQVRIRALFNETDIGQVRPGQQATVTVDAYQDRRFMGQVEKIEPQAVVQQNVTMFPVLVTLNNQEGLLKPGMNGEVSVLVEQLDNVIAVSNDAIKNTREAAAVAPMLGLNPDSVQADVRAQFASARGGMGGGMGGGGAGAGAGAGASGAPAAQQSGGRRPQTSQGEVALDPQAPQQGGGGFGGGQFQQVEVTDKDCATIDAAMKKHPKEAKQLDDLRAQMMQARQSGGDPRAFFEQQRTIYTAIGVDARMAGACRRRQMGGGMQAQGGAPAAGRGGRAGRGDAKATQGAPSGAGLRVASEMSAMPRRTRPGLVFVAENNTFRPRVVMLGQSNFDYTEVVSGLKEGEKVALLASLALQAQRQQQNDRMRQGMGVPGMTPGAGGGPGGGAPRGGAGGGAPRGR